MCQSGNLPIQSEQQKTQVTPFRLSNLPITAGFLTTIKILNFIKKEYNSVQYLDQYHCKYNFTQFKNGFSNSFVLQICPKVLEKKW